MDVAANQLVNGLTAGAEYALIAAGLALIFGVLGIVNFAHGEFYMVGAYVMFAAQDRGDLPYGIAAILALLLMAVFGVLFYVLVIRRLLDVAWQIQLVATLATSIVLLNLAVILGGSLPQLISSPLSSVIVSIGDARFAAQRVVILVATALTFAGLYGFLRYTKLGKAIRAMSQNREAAAVVGIPVQRVGLAAVVVSAVLAGVAAVTIAPLYNVQPTMGQLVSIKAFAAVIMGGFGNVTGAVIAAFAIGLVEAFAIGYVSSDYATVLVFGMMILVLLVRPEGLFGRASRT